MFENSTNFDFDDDFLESSFSSVITSTQQDDRGLPISSPNSKEVKKIIDNHLAVYEEEPFKKKLKLSEKEKSFKHSSCELIQESSSSLNASPKVVKRKFPGPAGLFDNSDVFASCSLVNNDAQIDDFFLCSQQTMSTFEDGPWKQMTKDFCVLDGNIAIYDKFNIAWIKKKSNSKLFKAPFLAAVIQSYEITDGKVPTVNVTLQDPTGCIQATLLHSLYEEKVDYLTTGSVLVLKSFGVLCAQNSHCLTITQNNLLRIYSLQTKKIDHDKQASVENIIIQEFNMNDILRNYNDSSEVTKTNCDSKVNRISNTQSGNAEVTNPLCVYEANKFSIPSVKPISSNISNVFIQNNSSIIKIPPESCRLSSFSDEMSCKPDSNKTFNFKKPIASNVTNGQKNGNSFSQISVKTDKSEHTEIWKNLFEDVDAESLFSDF